MADHLASGPLTSAELAAAVGADAGAIARLARAGAGLDLLQADPPGRYSLTAMVNCLRTGPRLAAKFAILYIFLVVVIAYVIHLIQSY